MSRRAPTAIFELVINHNWIRCSFRRGVAGMVCFCFACTSFWPHGVRTARGQTHVRVESTSEPGTSLSHDHFLRDSIPATMAASAPPDTADDGFTLPEEKSKKQLTKEIVMWTVIAAFVAFFIVKVFIEKDDAPVESGSNGKPITPPR